MKHIILTFIGYTSRGSISSTMYKPSDDADLAFLDNNDNRYTFFVKKKDRDILKTLTGCYKYDLTLHKDNDERIVYIKELSWNQTS